MTKEELASAMERHGDMVYRLALCRLQHIGDSEDVCQEVFLRLFSQDAGTWDEEHLRAWLIRATVNRCNDVARWRHRRQTVPLEAAAEQAAPREEREVWEAVAALPAKLRTVTHLHYAEGYTTQEIAHLLRLPDATVRTRLYRARETLRKQLGGDRDE